MKLNPYLLFDRQCEAAFKFYEKNLGGKIEMMMPFGDTPMAEQTPAGDRNQIAHARMVLGDQVLMGSDCPGGRYEKPQGFSVSLNIGKVAEAERVFHALAENGKVTMPIQKTFWAERFGTVTDKFGTPWMVNCEKPA